MTCGLVDYDFTNAKFLGHYPILTDIGTNAYVIACNFDSERTP